MRGLIIGAGAIGRRHMENLHRLKPQMALDVLSRSGEADAAPDAQVEALVKALASALRSAPDFAVIATPSHLHAACLVPLLNRGIPCYIEKPLVSSWCELDDLAAAVARLRTLPCTLVGCNLRFLGSLVSLRSLIRDGAIGIPVRGNLSAGQWLPDWRPQRDYRESYSADRARGGGVILDLIHEVDQARWLFGDFSRVQAIAGKYSSLEIASEDTACILLGRDGGPVISINLDYVSRRRVRRYEIVGEKGTLVWDMDQQSLDFTTADDRRSLDCGSAGFDVAGTYLSAMAEFLDCVERRRADTTQDVADAMKSAELALKAREAAGL